MPDGPTESTSYSNSKARELTIRGRSPGGRPGNVASLLGGLAANAVNRLPTAGLMAIATDPLASPSAACAATCVTFTWVLAVAELPATS